MTTLTVFSVLSGLSAFLATSLPAGASRHDTHASLARVVVQDTMVLARIRMFKDDLEHGLARFHKTDSATVANHQRLDSLVQPYLAKTFLLSADGRALTGEVTQVGVEKDEAGWPMVWVLVQYRVPATVRRLAVKDEILFEMFDNQQNLVHLLVLPSGERRTLYFVAGSGEQVVGI